MSTSAVRAERHVLVPPELPSRGLRRGGEVVQLCGETMGTTWRLAYRDRTGSDVACVTRAVQAVLDAVVAQMSTWHSGSDICRYNAAPPDSWLTLPAAFATVLERAYDVAERSAGAFDPTIGPLVELWGFGSAASGHRVPGDGEIAEARTRVGWQRATFDAERGRILQPGGVGLDLSSIAKGFGVDEMARCLQALGLDSYLCEIGGELRGCGCKPDGSPWWVRLEVPPGLVPAQHDSVIALCGKAVATSGNYVRAFDQGGRSYGHTIDPRTGRPVNHALLAVAVVADDCMTADALATAILVLGPDAGLAWATRETVAARLVIAHSDGARLAYTPALSAYL